MKDLGCIHKLLAKHRSVLCGRCLSHDQSARPVRDHVDQAVAKAERLEKAPSSPASRPAWFRAEAPEPWRGYASSSWMPEAVDALVAAFISASGIVVLGTLICFRWLTRRSSSTDTYRV